MAIASSRLLPTLALATLVTFFACGGGSSSGSSTPPPPSGTTAQVLLNGGLEAVTPLAWQGDINTIQPAPGTSHPNIVPHGGTQLAWLGGYGQVASDQITQDIYIPATATSATATFFLKILTAETGATATDTLTVAALSTTGATLGTLLTKSNLDVSNYTSYSVDLLPHKGKVVRLSFKSQEDAQNATSFLLDDVSVNIVAPAADLKPLITSFTPTSGNVGEASVQIRGGNFFGVTGVSIGGANASYTQTDGTSLSATVPATATGGSAPITISNAQGTGSSTSAFSSTLALPTIKAVNPTQGPVGTPVVITGTHLSSTGSTLTLNGQALSFVTQSSTQITFTVPTGAASGALVLTTSAGPASSSFTVTTSSTTLDFHIEQVQLTQSTQTLDNSVPIVAGKNGLIRVFVLANQANTAAPAVQVTLLNNGATVAGYPKTILAPGGSVPTALNEGSLGTSWNLSVPGTDLTTPIGTGYSLQAVVDPASAILETDKTNNTATVTLAGATAPLFRTTIFPVVLSTGTGDISAANKDQWVARLAKMYPVASVDVVVGAPFTGSISTLSSDGKDGSWDTLLNDLTAKHLADGASDRYYYGALKVGYSSGTAGLGWAPSSPSDSFKYRTAMGWDKAAGYADGGLYPEVFAHETGHNMGRNHSPCPSGANAPASLDPSYPYAGAAIGVWGYDTALNALHSPSTDKDIMAYCTPNWVSDYTYKGILNFRGATSGFLVVNAEDAPLPSHLAVPRECLIVRGIVHEDGRVDLLPSFRTRALPSELPSQGEYTLEGLDSLGLTTFSTHLELMDLGCSPAEHARHFVMALPLDSALLDSLAGLKVIKSGQVQTSLRSVSLRARKALTTPGARRLTEDKVQLSWDAATHPAVMVRDADTGEVIAILAGGRHTFAAKGKRLDLVLSDGVTGPTHRLEPTN